jgi:hypothetical protein
MLSHDDLRLQFEADKPRGGYYYGLWPGVDGRDQEDQKYGGGKCCYNVLSRERKHESDGYATH